MSRKTVRVIQRIFRAVCIIGLFLFLGAAGASDFGQVGTTQVILRGGIGLLMFCGGAWLGGLLT